MGMCVGVGVCVGGCVHRPAIHQPSEAPRPSRKGIMTSMVLCKSVLERVVA